MSFFEILDNYLTDPNYEVFEFSVVSVSDDYTQLNEYHRPTHPHYEEPAAQTWFRKYYADLDRDEATPLTGTSLCIALRRGMLQHQSPP
jgi:hypothetical protein